MKSELLKRSTEKVHIGLTHNWYALMIVGSYCDLITVQKEPRSCS